MIALKEHPVQRLIAVALSVSIVLCSTPLHSETFPKGIKYLGGPGFDEQAIKKVRGSWDNSLNITDQEMTLGFKKNELPTEIIPVPSVTRITYGQATTRRVGKWIAVGILLAPVALVGIFHKSRQHRVLIEWNDDQGRERGMLMQVHKDNFVGLLNALSFRTQKPVYADADDKEWLFKNGVKAELDEEAAEEGQ